MSNGSLRGSNTLITGASSGIGEAAARMFAAEGSNLLLLARDGEKLRTISSEIESRYGVECRILIADVSDTESLNNVFVSSRGEIEVNIAVINAGIGQYGPFHLARTDDITRVLRTNLEGAIVTAHLVLPGMIRRRSGSIVFVSSVLGKRALPWNATYCASKYGMHGFADALRLELRPMGIHVGVVAPARTDTAFFDRMIYSAEPGKQRNVPTHSPESVASAIVKTVTHKRREMVLTSGGKILAWVGSRFPRISDFLSRIVPSPEQT